MYSNNQQLNDVTNAPSMDFSDFIRACTFPQCICVTHGSFVSDKVQISRGDVLILKSCIARQVTICVPNNTDSFVKVNVTLDSGLKFKVLPPAHVDSSGNTIMYPTIADLLMDCPTHFEATTAYDDPYLPGMSVSAGDRFWFVRIIRDFKNGQERLQVRDSKDNTAILSQDCMGYFRPLNDDNEYTIRELIGMAPVQRRLLVAKSDVISDTQTIYNVYQASDISRKNNITQIYNENAVTIRLEYPVGDQHLPVPSDGIVYMNKPELNVVVSPYNDLETTWQIPVSANLQVRTYSQNDYEIPVTKLQKQHLCIADTLLEDELPVFMAPNAPLLVAPHTPIEIHNFVDMYCSIFPVIAKVVSTAVVHPFLQQVLNGVDEIIICKLDVVKRLYVKDTKSDTVFALSKDVKLSFVEYPQQFKTVSELARLPVGSEVIILEDIAADFPKPLSLRFGDVIKVTSNIPGIIKTKLAGGDCQVLKCDRIDPEAGGSTRLKLPLDFEVTMLLKTDENSSRLISVHDLLNGVVPIPSKNVMYVSEDVSNDAVHNLPTNLQIFKRVRETCIVAKISSTLLKQTPQLFYSPQEDISLMRCSSDDPATLPNIGIPLTSRLVLAFRDRFNVHESHEEASVVDLVPPIEKMTTVEFEERQRYLQDHSDYEDVESGSSSTVDEYGSTSDVTTRISSQGMLEKIQKNAKLDTVRRFRHALNPKYWRQTKPRPPPLPHPSAMGPALFTLNHNKADEIGSNSVFFKFTDDECTSLNLITARDSAESENFYEELEINPCKPTMSAAPLCPYSAFSGPGYIPLPPSNNPPKLIPKCTKKQKASETSDNGTLCLSDTSQGAHSKAQAFNENGEDHNRKHTSEIYKPLMRVKTWANHFGNSMGNRFSIRLKNDTPIGNTAKLVHDGMDCEVTADETTHVEVMCSDDRCFDSNLSLTRSKSQSELWDLNYRRNCANNSFSPVTLAYDGKDLPDLIKTQIRREEQESIMQPSYDFQHSISSKMLEPQTPKPKPRTLNKPLLLASDHRYQTLPQITNEQFTLNATDYSELVETLPDDAKSTDNPGISLSHTVDNKHPPKPLPKPRNRTSTIV